ASSAFDHFAETVALGVRKFGPTMQPAKPMREGTSTMTTSRRPGRHTECTRVVRSTMLIDEEIGPGGIFIARVHEPGRRCYPAGLGALVGRTRSTIGGLERGATTVGDRQPRERRHEAER